MVQERYLYFYSVLLINEGSIKPWKIEIDKRINT
jgi:hypothetical protein